MPDQTLSITNALENTKTKLALLEELDLLESEFRLIENEYTQRRHRLEKQLKALP